MNSKVITESGMSFGPFPDGDCFYIEKSKTYAKIQPNVKMAEFLVLRPGPAKTNVWIIEAKSSSPKPEPQTNFEKFIAEIQEKLVNAFGLSMALHLNRHISAYNELPQRFKQLDLAETDYKFVLVINGHKDEWLVPLKDALLNALRAMINVWALGPLPVAVLNDIEARKIGLIT